MLHNPLGAAASLSGMKPSIDGRTPARDLAWILRDGCPKREGYTEVSYGDAANPGHISGTRLTHPAQSE